MRLRLRSRSRLPAASGDRLRLGDAPVVEGELTLLCRIGGGGTSEAWTARLARSGMPPRIVVAKRLRPELAGEPGFLRMLASEARLATRLHHENLVAALGLMELDGEPLLVVEHVDGCDLSELLAAYDRAGRTLPPAPAVRIVRDVARGLAYAHALAEGGRPLGIVHRDVNPSNVMLGFDGSVKLVDFGIAKALHAVTNHRTATRELKGKLSYMAPEQLPGPRRAVELDGRVDQYALAVTLHELLTGQRLFAGGGMTALVRRINEGDATPPSLLNAAVPRALDAICLRARAVDREQRFADCGAFADALTEVAATLGDDAEERRRLLEPLRGRARRQARGGGGRSTLRAWPRSRIVWLVVVVAVVAVALVAALLALRR